MSENSFFSGIFPKPQEWNCWIKECDYLYGSGYLPINENNSGKETRRIMCKPIVYFP